jgi:hypothetical protein
MKRQNSVQKEVRFAKGTWGNLNKPLLVGLRAILKQHHLSILRGDLLLLEGRWYVTHSGLLAIASRKRCHGMSVNLVKELCDRATSSYTFRAMVYTSPTCKGFSGYGDADPTNVSSLVRGAEMRVAETRAINRALRKAYGIGICSVEELGSFNKGTDFSQGVKKLPAQSSNGHSWAIGPRVRDRLCQVIRQHQLDAALVKSYATDFCGVKSLREATREQVENFVVYLADWAEKDRNALLCQLNSYLPRGETKEGAG